MNRLLICLFLVCIILCACSNGNYSSLSSTSQSTINNASQYNSSNFQLFNTDAETGFIRPDGHKIVLKEKYDKIYPFSYNRSVVLKNGKYGVIDDRGNLVTKMEYDYVDSIYEDNVYQLKYIEGSLIVGYARNYEIPAKVPYSVEGVIDVDGNYIIEPIYNGIQRDEITGHYYVKDMFWKYGALTQSGDIAIPIIYDRMRLDEKNRIKVRIGNKWGYINDANEIIIPIEYSKIGEFNEDGLAIAKPIHINYSEEDIGVWGNYPYIRPSTLPLNKSLLVQVK